MINGVKCFFEVWENTNCTFSIVKGIPYIFKHDKQSHICGVVIPKAKLILIHYFAFVQKT